MYKKFLVLIERSDEEFPAAEILTKNKICEYVDTVSGTVDGIGKYEGEEKNLERICRNFGIKVDIKEIEKEILRKERNKPNPFWLRLEVIKTDGIEEKLNRLKNYEEIYLTKDGTLFLRSRERYNSEVSRVEDLTLRVLKNYIDWGKRIETHFVFKRFS
ncbi:MAG: hypothetical protein QXD43_00910 [Candidatus Aenigmatarchaeota archaeon]